MILTDRKGADHYGTERQSPLPKIGTEIPAPFYASAGAAALDLHACVDQAVTIPPAGGR